MDFIKWGYLFGCGVLFAFAVKCPRTVFQWNVRAKNLNCTDGEVYHCILDQENEVIEVCFERIIIAPGEGGCPLFVRDGDKMALGNPFRECPTTLNGCPPANHSGYYLDMLYIYPSCLEYKSTKNESNSLIKLITYKESPTKEKAWPCLTGDHRNDREALVIVSVFLVIFVFAVALGTLWYILRGRQQPAEEVKSKIFSPETDSDYRERLLPNDGAEETLLKIRYPEADSSNKDACSRLAYDSGYSTPGQCMVTEKTGDLIIERNEMHYLHDHLLQNQTAFLIGGWGSGKSTILEWYLNKTSPEQKHIAIFNCTNKFTFIESLKEWQKSLQKANKAFNFRSPEKKRPEISKKVIEMLEAVTSENLYGFVFLVFKEVGKECRKIVLEIVKQTKCKEMVKYIVSCQDGNWLSQTEYSIDVHGFDEKTAIEYVKDCIQHDEERRELSKLLEYSPIALHCAKMYIKHTNISARGALQLFRRILKQDYIAKITLPQKIPLIFVMEILKCTNPLVYDILQSLQFIRCNDIPIILLKFLHVPTFKKRIPVLADSFVLNVRSFSFITVTGHDLDRVINIHPDLLVVFQHTGDEDSRSQCLKALLKSFASLLSKCPCPPVTRERCVQLLPHAQMTLHYAYTQLSSDPSQFDDADFILLTSVYDRVIYTLSAFGMEKDAKNLTTEFLNLCRFFPKGKIVDPNQSAEITYKKYAESFGSDEKAERLQRTATDFILNKARGKRYLSFLGIEDQAVDNEYQISLEDYKRLVNEGKAIDPVHNGRWLFLQAHISIALTLGMKNSKGICISSNSISEDDLKYIEYASFLAKLLAESKEFKGKTLYSVLDAEINGSVELLLSDRNQEYDVERLLETIEKTLESTKSDGYYVACTKASYDTDMYIYISAMAQCIRLYLWRACETNDSILFDKATDIAEELREFLATRKDFIRESFTAQTAKQCIVKCYIMKERYGDALDTLVKISSFDPLGDGDHILTKHDIIDIELKCKCLKLAKKDVELDTIVDKIDTLRTSILLSESELGPELSQIIKTYGSNQG